MTVGNYLNNIEDSEIRVLAIKNAIDQGSINKEVRSINSAINSFIWIRTQEGYVFWCNIFSKNQKEQNIKNEV